MTDGSRGDGDFRQPPAQQLRQLALVVAQPHR
jgi:hypothetical protein